MAIKDLWNSRKLLLVAFLYSALTGVGYCQAVPSYVFSSPLLPRIVQMPGNTWFKANTNLFKDVWTPPELEPLDLYGVTHTPSKIILAWSGFAWDSNRGILMLYGGGHNNYTGNDVYRWHSSTLQWERASLPSDVYLDPVEGYVVIDGVDAAPASSHTYDNNSFLPIVDRFLTWGGATYNQDGGPYRRASEVNPATTRLTGPYLFDPNRANGNKVGGTTGSHVKRVAPHPEIVGGQMWENRDIPLHLAGQPQPGVYINGCSVPVVEGGRDVVYVVGNPIYYSSQKDLYRYQLTAIGNPALDQISKVGAFSVGTGGETSCGFDPARKLFVRVGDNTAPFFFWDLTTPGPTNGDKKVQIDATIAGLQSWLSSNGINLQYCTLKFDPMRHTYLLWCGAATIWELHAPPGGNTTAGWTITKLPTPPAPAPPGDTGGTGVMGKWRYAPFYDVFVGLEDPEEGHVWIYKPAGWVQPNPAGNALPVVSISTPADGLTVAPGTSLNLTAAAFDADGTVVRVEYYANGTKLGQAATAPWTVPWTPILVGSYKIVAIAVDNVGGMTASAGVNLTVTAPLTTTILQRGLAGYLGASDTYLNALSATTAHGASDPLYLDGAIYAPLVRFSIFNSEGGPVPDGAVVQSATLQLYKQHYDNPLQLNALLKPWVESQATWFNSRTGTAWTLPGAGGAGSDYLSAPDVVTAGSFYPGWMAFDVTQRVRQWSSAAGANYGWRLKQATPTYGINQFSSSEYASNPTLRPKLTIVYAPPAPPQLALYRPSTNRYFVDFDFDHVPDLSLYFGAPGDVGLAGRIDDDTLTDFVLYRGGIWYVRTNSDGNVAFITIFGGAGDIPLLADFDGDGRDDLVVYRNGVWYVSTTLTSVASQTFHFGGVPGDIPLAGDVNGDGIPDLVIFRNGLWYISTKRDGIADMAVYFGAPGDAPLLFDWDGDGKADLCVFRNGIWYVNTHFNGTVQATFGFGTTGDIPLTGRFN